MLTTQTISPPLHEYIYVQLSFGLMNLHEIQHEGDFVYHCQTLQNQDIKCSFLPFPTTNPPFFSYFFFYLLSAYIRSTFLVSTTQDENTAHVFLRCFWCSRDSFHVVSYPFFMTCCELGIRYLHNMETFQKVLS